MRFVFGSPALRAPSTAPPPTALHWFSEAEKGSNFAPCSKGNSKSGPIMNRPTGLSVKKL